MGIKKHSVTIAGHATSLSLETEFWDALREISGIRQTGLRELIEEVDQSRQTNLSSALRLYVLQYFRGKQSEFAKHQDKTGQTTTPAQE